MEVAKNINTVTADKRGKIMVNIDEIRGQINQYREHLKELGGSL